MIPKRPPGADHLYQGNKLKPKDLVDLKWYIRELEQRLIIARELQRMNK
jgi:hypothetical protein